MNKKERMGTHRIQSDQPPNNGDSLLVVDPAHDLVIRVEPVLGHDGALEECEDDEAGDPEGGDDVVPPGQIQRALSCSCVC